MYSASVRITNLIFELCSDNLSFHQKLIARFKNFLASGSPVQVSITFNLTKELIRDFWQEPLLEWGAETCRVSATGIEGVINVEKKNAVFDVSPTRTIYEIEQIIRIAAAIWVYQYGGLLLHGAGLVNDNKGYLFTGVSGAGKTTVCRVSKQANILNDDLVGLIPENGEWQIWSTPFSNPTQVTPNPGHAIFFSMFRLIQANQHRLDEITAAVALAELISHVVVVNSNNKMTESVFLRCLSAIQKIYHYELYFLPDDGFWSLLP